MPRAMKARPRPMGKPLEVAFLTSKARKKAAHHVSRSAYSDPNAAGASVPELPIPGDC